VITTGLDDPKASAPAPATGALELRDITAAYGRTTVLRDVSVSVGRGVVQALLGPNGAGKTTLLRTAAGLMRPSSGSIWLGGEDVTKQPAFERAHGGVCLVPEGRGIFRRLSVRDNLTLQIPPWAPRGTGMDRALEAFPILKQRLGQIAGTMSGGEQQILAVARCYVSSPSVVLLDEVSMGLAPRIVDQIFESLMRLVSEGISILLVEQYVNRALEMASTVYLLNRGEIAFSGPASDLDEATVMRGYLGADLGSGEGVATEASAEPMVGPAHPNTASGHDKVAPE